MARSISRGAREIPCSTMLVSDSKDQGPAHMVSSLRRRRCLGPQACKTGRPSTAPYHLISAYCFRAQMARLSRLLLDERQEALQQLHGTWRAAADVQIDRHHVLDA